MKLTKLIPLCILFLAACTPQYTLVPAGAVTAKGISVDLARPWNKSPFSLGSKVEVWTKDGQALNQLMFVGGVAKSEGLFKASSKELPMPAFDPDMLPNELVDLTVTSLKNLMGGEITLETANLRPQRVSGSTGFRFNVAYHTHDGLERYGDVLATIKDDQLFMIIFMAAKLHYYDVQQTEVEKIFSSVKI